jgi:hypothetical protein
MAVVSSAPVIAAAAMAARRRVLNAFRQADATSDEKGIGFTPAHRMDERYFDALVAYGAIRETGRGTFWLDEARVSEHDSRRRKRAFAIMGGVLAATAALLGFTQL